MLSNIHTEHCARRMLVLILALMIFCAAVPEVTAAEQTGAVDTNGTQLRIGPVLMVTDYAVIEGERGPGSSFILEMNIANLSEHASAHNVVATLTIENTSVSLQEGVTNQLYFHEILPTETVTVQFPLEVYSYATEENMILSMTMTCYDDAAVHYDFQTMMTPDIEVARTLDVASLVVPQFVHRNSSMIISATLHNVELVTLSNIKMHVVTQYGEEITEVGQLLKEESRTVDCIYRFPEQQTEDVQVYFTYESLYGHEFSTEPKSFQVVVYDPVEQDDFVSNGKLGLREIMTRLVQGIPIFNTDVRIPIPVIVLILIGVGGYGAVLYVTLIKKKEE